MTERKYSEIQKDSFEPEEIPKSTKSVKKSAKMSDIKIVNQKEAKSIANKAKERRQKNRRRIFRSRGGDRDWED